MKPFESFLAPKLQEFIAYRLSLGYAKRGIRSALLSFDHYLKEQQAQDIPRYTADQVIYIASQYSPVCLVEKTTPSWEVRYISNGKWLVIKKCIFRTGAAISIEQWDFYEDSSKLVKR